MLGVGLPLARVPRVHLVLGFVLGDLPVCAARRRRAGQRVPEGSVVRRVVPAHVVGVRGSEVRCRARDAGCEARGARCRARGSQRGARDTGYGVRYAVCGVWGAGCGARGAGCRARGSRVENRVQG